MNLYRFHYANGRKVTFACREENGWFWARRFGQHLNTQAKLVEFLRPLAPQLRLV